ncbi:MAG: aminotransferase class V-fold PLP-dependent enzyme, partial [Candidatus Sumerlaeia bacterium]|nr:aminotransferase class V-fold PLP-dependent enzyme [Candidatus Sumerlaeia bacterium]
MRYFDHAATTPLDPRVRDALVEHAGEPLNPASIHGAGQHARRLLEHARGELAEAIGLHDPARIVFTSGATEAANLVLRGLADALARPLRVLSSPIEHACIRQTLESLERAGRARVHLLPVAEDGTVQLAADKLPEADLLCLMHANNETGVLQDVERARELARRHGMLWLCDACQSPARVLFDADALGADFVLLSAHKLYGPVGVGCLAGPGVDRLMPQLTGGAQEDERRAGTVAVALARAFAAAAALAVRERQADAARLRIHEHALLAGLHAAGVAFRLNGDAPRLPGFLNLSFADHAAL